MSSLRDQLRAIYDERGRLTPALVVDAATPDDHPLHHRFEWDDSIAGPLYREQQAADLIREVRVVYAKTKQGPKSTRAFTPVFEADSAKANYMPTEQALADPLVRQIILHEMEREWKAFQRRYNHMREFADLIRRSLEGDAA